MRGLHWRREVLGRVSSRRRVCEGPVCNRYRLCLANKGSVSGVVEVVGCTRCDVMEQLELHRRTVEVLAVEDG